MAIVQIDLETGIVRCTACGAKTLGTHPSPCPTCGVTYDRVQYRRHQVVKHRGKEKSRIVLGTTTTYGRTTFCVGDFDLEKRIAVDYEWSRQAYRIAQEAMAKGEAKGLTTLQALDLAKKKFYLERGIVIETLQPEDKAPVDVKGGQP